METTTTGYTRKELQAQKKISQPGWLRITLLVILGYEAAGCLLGGSFLIAKPDGRLMDMNVDIMHGVFRNFLVPGIILFGLGILNTGAFVAVLRKKPFRGSMAGLALGGVLLWFWIEIAILQELHWLQAMWGIPAVVGALVGVPLFSSRKTMMKVALLCGILSSSLYFVINIIVPMQYPGYNLASRAPSELSAIGAPTQILWSVLAAPYTLLILAFAWGVWKSGVQNRRLRIAGGLMIAYGALGFIWPFAPMHQREILVAGGATFSDTMHIALGAATEVIYLLALGFAAGALGKQFRIYSIITFIVLLVFGVLTFLDAPGISTNQPTPFIGIWERINIGVFLVWVVVLAIDLLRNDDYH